MLPNLISVRFEKELEALRKELAEVAISRSGATTPGDGNLTSHSRTASEDNLSTVADSPVFITKELGPSDYVPTPSISIESESSEDLETKKDR